MECYHSLIGFEIWGDMDWTYQNGLSMRTAGAIENILPIIESNSSIVLQNTANARNNLKFIVYDNTGLLISTKYLNLNANESQSIDSDSFITQGFEGTVVITSSGTLNALVELNRSRNDGYLAEAIPAQTTAGSSFLFPHIASNNQWSTEIMLVNISDNSEDITITAFDADGNELAGITKTQTITGHGRLYTKIRDLFNETDEIAYLRATADNSLFIAHLIYYTNEGYGHIMGGTVVKPFD